MTNSTLNEFNDVEMLELRPRDAVVACLIIALVCREDKEAREEAILTASTIAAEAGLCVDDAQSLRDLKTRAEVLYLAGPEAVTAWLMAVCKVAPLTDADALRAAPTRGNA